MDGDSFGVLILDPSGTGRGGVLENALRDRVEQELALAGETLVIPGSPGTADFDGCAASVAVVFYGASPPPAVPEVLADFIDRGKQVFPVVEDLGTFGDVVPKALAGFNGFEMHPQDGCDELATLVLESLGLLRATRRIFISYARHESRAVAVQLHDALVRRWYDVFLDTHSIRPGELFQDSLKASLADCDMMVLLRTPEITTRQFVREEIAFADQAGLGVLQVIWPGEEPLSNAAFFDRYELQDPDFLHSHEPLPERTLQPAAVSSLLHAVSAGRVDAQRYRERQLVQALCERAKENKVDTIVHPGRFVRLEDSRTSDHVEFAIGVPDSRRLEETVRRGAANAAASRQTAARLLYDPLGLTRILSDHLAFTAQKFDVDLLPKDRTEDLF